MWGTDEGVVLNGFLLVPGLLGCFTGGGFTWCLAALFTRTGFVAPFNPIIPQKRPPAALGGGLALGAGVAGALFLGQLLGMVVGRAPLVPVLAASPALLLGIADDIRAFEPRTKLAFQFAVAIFSMVVVLGTPSNGGELGLLLIGIGASVVLMNAVNFLDVSDGYAAAICAASFLGLTLWSSNPLAAALTGVCLGFLVLNRPPAKIYMGDAGSHFLGTMGANLTVITAQAQPWSMVAIMALGCLTVPLLELTLVTLIRWRKGISIWRGSADHSALRLQAAGLGKGRTLLIVSAAQLLLVALSVYFWEALPR